MKKKTIERRRIAKDAWNLDYSFCNWIIPRLDYLEKRMYSYPAILVSEEEWHNILKQMKQGFIDYQECDVFEAIPESTNKSFELLKKYFKNLWD